MTPRSSRALFIRTWKTKVPAITSVQVLVALGKHTLSLNEQKYQPATQHKR